MQRPFLYSRKGLWPSTPKGSAGGESEEHRRKFVRACYVRQVVALQLEKTPTGVLAGGLGVAIKARVPKAVAADVGPGQQPPEALGFNQRLHRRPPLRWDEVEHGLPVVGDESIHVDQLGEPLWRAIGNPADHRP